MENGSFPPITRLAGLHMGGYYFLAKIFALILKFLSQGKVKYLHIETPVI